MIERPSWDRYFASIVKDVSARATCLHYKIGAVIVNEKHEIVATGYNGPVRGAPHCDITGCIKDKLGIGDGMGHGVCVAVHAETNALLSAGKLSEGSMLYVDVFPCKICARLIVNAGIRRVVVSGTYPDSDGLKILSDADVSVTHMVGENKAGREKKKSKQSRSL
jgi:dCMP deaminase